MIPLLEFSPNRPVVVVPDVHQDLGFLDRAVAFASAEGAALCFLGDHVDAIDARWRSESALRATAAILPELAENYAPGCVFLAGNHDVDALRTARIRARLLLDGETERVAQLDAALPASSAYGRLLGLWPMDFLQTWGLVAVAHGYLLSHAGVARRHWPWGVSSRLAEQTATFVRESNAAWSRWLETGEEGPLFAAGPARGGRSATVGGVLWLDWDEEFVDDLPLPQIVGHTRAFEPRRKDRSWCLDATQSAVGLLEPDRGLRIRRL